MDSDTKQPEAKRSRTECSGDVDNDKGRSADDIPHSPSGSKVTDSASTWYDGAKVADDNVRKRSVELATGNIEMVDANGLANESTIVTVPPNGAHAYSNAVKTLLEDLLNLYHKTWTAVEDHLDVQQNKQKIDHFDGQIGQEICTLRFIRERAGTNFHGNISANFAKYTMENNPVDIAFEVTQEKAKVESGGMRDDVQQKKVCLVSVIETKSAQKPNDGSGKGSFFGDLNQLICYLVTKVRPIERDTAGWLLRGLLLYRSVGYMVELCSNGWLDYPWSCSRIARYENIGSGIGLSRLLLFYLRKLLGSTARSDQLFTEPNKLTFLQYPVGAQFISNANNIVKCKWMHLVSRFPKTEKDAKLECRFSKVHTLTPGTHVVLKIVSPTIYPYNGEPAQILACLDKLLVIIDFSLKSGEYDSDVNLKQRLLDLSNLYVHNTTRGSCLSSRLVVTLYRGARVCAHEQLKDAWRWRDEAGDAQLQAKRVREQFFKQVCLIAFDVVYYFNCAHSDIRPPNVVYDAACGFTLIDWENAKSVEQEAGFANDSRYPVIQSVNHRCRWLIFSAYQLLMTIYLMDKAAEGVNPKKAEDEIVHNKMFWTTDTLTGLRYTSDFPHWRERTEYRKLLNNMNSDMTDASACRAELEALLQSALMIA